MNIIKEYKTKGKTDCYIIKKDNGKYLFAYGETNKSASITWPHDTLEEAKAHAKNFLKEKKHFLEVVLN